MKGFNQLLIISLLVIITILAYNYKKNKLELSKSNSSSKDQIEKFDPIIEKPRVPETPKISLAIPNYLDYPRITEQLKIWQKEAKDIAEVGFYGQTKRKTDICYLRINNKLDKKDKPKVMITACIHGNEPWATGCVMATAGTLLDGYNKDKEITELINSRDIYIIPVVSPDSYPHSRHIDGVDPNRDFPGPSRPNHKSTYSIAALENFFNEIKPNAIISGHTYGRVILIPYGDKREKTNNEKDYSRIIGEMSKTSGYAVKRACDMYDRPIFGSEIDWYYRGGAFSIVMEFGTHQRIPTHQEINSEFNQTWESIKFFIKEAPIVEIIDKTSNSDFLENKGISENYLRIQLDGLRRLNRK